MNLHPDWLKVNESHFTWNAHGSASVAFKSWSKVIKLIIYWQLVRGKTEKEKHISRDNGYKKKKENQKRESPLNSGNDKDWNGKFSQYFTRNIKLTNRKCRE